jgi:tripartite-type tricarboxylate transporter receptor subunit TctC
MQRRSVLKTLGSTVAMVAGGAVAQTDGRPIRLVVPLPAGSSNDFVARTLAPHVATALGQPIIIDNKAGANGVIGTTDVIRSAPDGQTLLIASVSPLAVNMALYSNVPYDSRRDLTPIAGVSVNPNILLVKSTFPASTFGEFIDYARKNPKRVSIGSSTAATQLQIQTINRLAGTDILVVPYKGSPATITDVLGETLTATFVDPGSALAQTKGGQMKALAVSSLKRSPIAPDWPAIAETLPGFDFSFWIMVAGPAGMSRDVVNRISNAVGAAQRQKDVIEKYTQAGTNLMVMGPDEVKAFLTSEASRWIKMAKDADVKPEPIS